MTAYAEVIGTWARSDDFTLNITVADRRALHPAVATMLGVFTNLTPLEIRGACRGSFLGRAHTAAAATQSRSRPSRGERRGSAALASRSAPAIRRRACCRWSSPACSARPTAPFPADVDVVYSITQTPQTWLDNKVYEADGGLGIDWDSPDALFAPGLLDAMCAAYVDLLHGLAGIRCGVAGDRPVARAQRPTVPSSIA